jgi:ABC-2 type transport system permease protein
MIVKLLNEFSAESRRIFSSTRRYPLQTFSGMLAIVVIFVAILSGAHFIAGPINFKTSREGSLLVGLVLWNLLLLSIGQTSSGIQGEAQIGTLEHLFLCSQSLLRVMIVRAVVSEILFLAMNMVILCVLLLVFRVPISFSPYIVIPLAGALLASNGLGLALGALALISKRIGSATQLLQFFLVSLVVPPFEQILPTRFVPLLNALPLIPAARALRDVMARGHSLSIEQTLVTLINGLFYLALGVAIFLAGEETARRRGALTGY